MKKPWRFSRGAQNLGRTAIAVVAIGVLAVGAAAALAGNHNNGPIKKVSRSNKGATKLARSIFQANGRRLVHAKFVTVPPGNDPVATSTKKLAGFPRKGGSYAILSTGCAHLASRKNNSNSTGCEDGGFQTTGARDVTIWRIKFHVPKGANCLSFRFKFLSEEFPEFVGSQFNDAFIAEVAHSPQWDASGYQTPTITAPGDFATTNDGNDIISVNATGVARVSRAAAKGTTYDAATAKLRASTRVKPGNHLLYLSLFDQGDRIYDSAVFVDRLLVSHKGKCRSGVVGTK